MEKEKRGGKEIEKGEAEQVEIYLFRHSLDASRRSRVAASIIEKQVVVYRSRMNNIAALVPIVSVERRAQWGEGRGEKKGGKGDSRRGEGVATSR